MAEQRYQAVLAVIADGLSASQVAEKLECRGRRRMSGLSVMFAVAVGATVLRSERPAPRW